MSGCVTSCEPCTGDPWPDRADGEVLAGYACGTHPKRCQPGFEDLLGAARDHVQESGGATAISDGCQVQDDGDEFVAVGGVAPHVFIHANDAHAIEPGRVVDQ